jgi:hypothetical protein
MATSNYQFVQQVMQSPRVRKALQNKAQAGAKVTDRTASAQGMSTRATVTSGTRPRGRPYSRISLPGGDEFGDYKTPRRRVLGLVAAQLRARR